MLFVLGRPALAKGKGEGLVAVNLLIDLGCFSVGSFFLFIIRDITWLSCCYQATALEPRSVFYSLVEGLFFRFTDGQLDIHVDLCF